MSNSATFREEHGESELASLRQKVEDLTRDNERWQHRLTATLTVLDGVPIDLDDMNVMDEIRQCPTVRTAQRIRSERDAAVKERDEVREQRASMTKVAVERETARRLAESRLADTRAAWKDAEIGWERLERTLRGKLADTKGVLEEVGEYCNGLGHARIWEDVQARITTCLARLNQGGEPQPAPDEFPADLLEAAGKHLTSNQLRPLTTPLTSAEAEALVDDDERAMQPAPASKVRRWKMRNGKEQDHYWETEPGGVGYFYRDRRSDKSLWTEQQHSSDPRFIEVDPATNEPLEKEAPASHTLSDCVRSINRIVTFLQCRIELNEDEHAALESARIKETPCHDSGSDASESGAESLGTSMKSNSRHSGSTRAEPESGPAASNVVDGGEVKIPTASATAVASDPVAPYMVEAVPSWRGEEVTLLMPDGRKRTRLTMRQAAQELNLAHAFGRDSARAVVERCVGALEWAVACSSPGMPTCEKLCAALTDARKWMEVKHA